jgi:hypothetical protein
LNNQFGSQGQRPTYNNRSFCRTGPSLSSPFVLSPSGVVCLLRSVVAGRSLPVSTGRSVATDHSPCLSPPAHSVGSKQSVRYCGFTTVGSIPPAHHHLFTATDAPQWVYYHRPNTVCSLPPAHHSGFTRYYRRTTPHQLTTVGSLPPHTVGSILPVHHTGFTTTVSLPPLVHCHRRTTVGSLGTTGALHPTS